MTSPPTGLLQAIKVATKRTHEVAAAARRQEKLFFKMNALKTMLLKPNL
jgi:hypothetical protein